jgi:hypothetical protein
MYLLPGYYHSEGGGLRGAELPIACLAIACLAVRRILIE